MSQNKCFLAFHVSNPDKTFPMLTIDIGWQRFRFGALPGLGAGGKVEGRVKIKLEMSDPRGNRVFVFDEDDDLKLSLDFADCHFDRLDLEAASDVFDLGIGVGLPTEDKKP